MTLVLLNTYSSLKTHSFNTYEQNIDNNSTVTLDSVIPKSSGSS